MARHQHLFGISFAVAALASLSGCGEPQTPSQPEPVAISRAAAISAAQHDAVDHFRLAGPSNATASREGQYWVVDLRSSDGPGLHYAITTDGSIHERRLVQ